MQGLLVLEDLKGLRVSQGLQEVLEQDMRALQVLQGILELKDLKDLLVNKEARGLLVTQEKLVLRVQRVL